MSDVIFVLLRSRLSVCQSRRLLLLENLALRHQLTVLRRQTRQPKLRHADRLLWLALRRWWPDWHRALVLVQPQTSAAWHRLGFRLFWRRKSRDRGGRPAAERKLLNLIRRMWSSNPTWGSKRIHAELAKLGIEVSDSTIRQYRPRTRRNDQTWGEVFRDMLGRGFKDGPPWPWPSPLESSLARHSPVCFLRLPS
jgi:putative transposase